MSRQWHLSCGGVDVSAWRRGVVCTWVCAAVGLGAVATARAQFNDTPSIVPPPSRYAVIDLGSLGRTGASQGFAVTDAIATTPRASGPVAVGDSVNDAGVLRPFIWTTLTGMIDGLPGIPGRGTARDINPFGDYVGTYSPALGPTLPNAAPTIRTAGYLASLRRAAIVTLPALGGPTLSSAAEGINAPPGTGTGGGVNIVGWSMDSSGRQRATLWSVGPVPGPTGPHDLGTLGGAHSRANAVNNALQVVGQAQRSDGQWRAAMFFPMSLAPFPVVRDLGVLPGGRASEATAISQNGIVVGWSELGVTVTPVPAPRRAVRFQTPLSTTANPTPINLGTLDPAHTASEARGVNSRGHIVGWSGTPSSNTLPGGSQRAFIVRDGTMIDLNTLIPASSGWRLSVANDISESGAIVGWGYRVASSPVNASVPRAFLLVPVRNVPIPVMPGEDDKEALD